MQRKTTDILDTAIRSAVLLVTKSADLLSYSPIIQGLAPMCSTRLAFILALAALGGTACTTERKPVGTFVNEKTPTIRSLPQTSRPMPPISPPDSKSASVAWTLADGRRMRLNDYQGKVVVLDFYATWCLPCRDEIPHLASLQSRFGSEGLQVVGLNVGGEEDRPAIPAFAKELGINYQLAYPTTEAVDLFMGGNTAIPQTLVFRRNGELLRHFTGYDATVRRELDSTVAEAIEERGAMNAER